MRSSAARRRLAGAAAGAAAMSLPLFLLWGFSVDDAWIIARVAARLAAGEGYRFNAVGPPVDAVTPLGFPLLLVPAGQAGVAAAHHFAKCLGAACGLLTGAWLGARLVADSWRGAVFLVPLAVCVPLSAWCTSGMETGVVVVLAALAAGAARGGSLAAGLAAALRPELLPYGLVLSIGRAVAESGTPRTIAKALTLALGPALIVALVRQVVFGSVTPLAAWAKPSDLGHGAFYAAAALLWTGIPALVCAPSALRRLSPWAWAVLAATAAHVASLTLVGGDWMPLFRLFVPVLPGLVLVAAELARHAPRWATGLRLAVALSLSLVLARDKGPAASQVAAQRAALVAEARPLLEGSRVVAALDVGWPGASTDAEIVDLAGVTDPRIARLPGAHTAKRLPESLLRARRVDALLLLFEGSTPEDVWRAPWSRQVEAQIAIHAQDLGFVLYATLELRGTSRRYAVLKLPK